MLKYQSLRYIEQIREFLEVCVPEEFQNFRVFWSMMISGTHRGRHKLCPDQHIGLHVEYWCLACETQLLPQVLESLCQGIDGRRFAYCGIPTLCFRFECHHSAPVSCCLPSLQIHHSAPVSWCSKIECHLVAALENMPMSLGCCFAPVS